jgi:hypothetical protein
MSYSDIFDLYFQSSSVSSSRGTFLFTDTLRCIARTVASVYLAFHSSLLWYENVNLDRKLACYAVVLKA